MHLNPHIGFPGNCAEAMAFYEHVFQNKIQFQMTYGESPMADMCPPENQGKIMHASLKVGDSTLMAADAIRGEIEKPRAITISVELQDTTEGERIFNALADGGAVEMPLQETFWAYKFGMVEDKFGVPWMVNCAKPMPSA